MITLVKDITTSQVSIDKLYVDFNKINRVNVALMVHFKSPYQTNFLLLYKGLKTETINLKGAQKRNVGYLPKCYILRSTYHKDMC